LYEYYVIKFTLLPILFRSTNQKLTQLYFSGSIEV